MKRRIARMFASSPLREPIHVRGHQNPTWELSLVPRCMLGIFNRARIAPDYQFNLGQLLGPSPGTWAALRLPGHQGCGFWQKADNENMFTA